LFSRDAENSSQEIVAQNANAPDEFVAERVFFRVESEVAVEWQWRKGWRDALRVAAKRNTVQ